MTKALHLVIPGLLGPWPGRHEPGFPSPEAPALERLLRRATLTRSEVRGADPTLFSLFGLPVSTGRDLPVAAVSRLAEGGDPAPGGWWLRADPVSLRADLHQVLLFDAGAISATEAQTLVTACNRIFEAEGLKLEAPHPQRWYLRLVADPGLLTYPLDEVVGRDIRPCMPQGPASRRWCTLLTEVQMLLYDHPINQERESRGRAAVNSVWFWGGGALPQGVRNPFSAIYAAYPPARGLARLTGIDPGPLLATAVDWRKAAQQAEQSLVVLENMHHTCWDDAPAAWVAQMNDLEQNWFAPCLDLLAADTVLHLYPCAGPVYTVTRGRLRRFWRRPRPLLWYC